MTYGLIAVLVLAFLVFTHKEREANAAVLAQFAKDAHEREQALLLRIQAPQVAIARDFNESVQPGPPAIDMSDGPMGDESYWMSREELAEKLAEEETARG